MGRGGENLIYVTAESAEGYDPVSLGTKFIRGADIQYPIHKKLTIYCGG
jgi:hypothetical protein